MTETVPLEKGLPNDIELEKRGITVNSAPHEFMEIFLPLKKNTMSKQGGRGKGEYPSIELFTSWTNKKAILANAGKGGSCYPTFTAFTVKEIRQHLGLYILNGLCPSPRIELKFKPQREDELHGNDFVYQAFGDGAWRRHRHFKCFFATQNPAIETPSKKKYPNWKVRPLIQWLNFINPKLWRLGKSFSVDEMTIGFQGKHADKLTIKYKRVGDGFQCDALCQDGYCYQVFFRNDPAPKEYLSWGLSPLHSRVMKLFDSVSAKYHHCTMDNLYNSTKFCKASYNHPKKVLCAGVTRKGMRGIPSCVIQQEVISRIQQRQVRGTVKAALLEGDPKCPGLVATSIYDVKPVNMLSMYCSSLKWMMKEKEVYNVETNRVEKMRFLRMEAIDVYNNAMGDVDISDQLREVYRFNHWTRNRKWWWSIMFWALGTMLVNSYILYVQYNLMKGRKKRDLLSHHDFRREIAMFWINPEYKGRVERNNEMRLRRLNQRGGSVMSEVTMDSSTCSTPRRKRQRNDDESSAVVKRKKATNFTSDSLGPHGHYNIRLDRTSDHLPIKATAKARCALHRWGGVETAKQVMYCQTCNASLCVLCYREFHSDPNLYKKQSILQRKFANKSVN